MDIKNKVAIVTGASERIGKATAKLLAQIETLKIGSLLLFIGRAKAVSGMLAGIRRIGSAKTVPGRLI